MATTVNVEGFAKGLRATRKKIRAAARPAAQAATDHCYSLARLFVPVSDEGHTFYGRSSKKTGVTYHFSPGTLRDAIYQVYSKANSSDGKATYHLSWNHTKAPYGYMVHNGTSRAPAHPFITRAMNAGKADALVIMKAEFIARVQE
ncbi:HK97-gp10 family putative phage morphogenesis protein [Acidovorax sp. NCPPB 4044]|uniref:HK97-gp10 family putative phage morphogenesis protein n=1 Tax=Acidovorax sp. NCPPB 4044 TaxID=2940490 RepID=UPI002302F101|nr:HK97-gp10 family putative phage morphogenesis protein [Acidovorax sp. NCPPB 4044]MDA8521982.1 hypothetical protein [Acidovorax sp. NCPPB 4044]